MSVDKKHVFKKGSDSIPKSSAGSFVKVTEDAPPVIIPQVNIDELISVEQHEIWDVRPALLFPCIGSSCPACKRGLDSKYKAFLPVLERGADKELTPKIYAFSISVVQQFEVMDDELGGIKGKAFKIIRTGKGLRTKYQVMPLGKEVDVSDYEALDPTDVVQVWDAEQIEEKLAMALGDVTAVVEGASADVDDDDDGGWDS